MAGNNTDRHQMLALALALPFINLSYEQIRTEFLSDKQSITEKYENSNFLKDMSDYVNTFTSDNYQCNYFDVESFNSKHSNNKHQYLKICHINIRSLNLNKHTLYAYLESLNCTFDIILITECGNVKKASIEEVFCSYKFYMTTPNSKKGGAGILIHEDLIKNIEIIDNNKHFICTYDECNKCEVESIWIKLTTKGNDKLVLGCIYRHPNGNITHFNEQYLKVLESINNNETCIIGGDFNIDLLNYKKNTIGDYLTINLENNFTPCITLPTRITAQSATLIDQIFVKFSAKKLQTKVSSGNLFCSISDHLMNFVLLGISSKKTKDRPYVRLFTEKRIKYFQEAAPNDPPLLPTKTDGNLLHNDIQLAFKTFLTNYKKMLDKYFPLVRLSRKKAKDKPWITTSIKNGIKHCSKLHKKHIPGTPSEKRWLSYKYELTNRIRAAETEYYRKLLADHNNSCQNLWKIFGKILKKDKNKINITKIKYENELITNPTEITDSFNKFFTNIGQNLADSIDNEDPNTFKKFLGNPVLQSFTLCETSAPEVQYQMSKINPKKSTGSDDMPGIFINISAPVVADTLSKLFNLSIREGEYPDILKIAKVIPIYKKGDHTDVNNYRPISILTHLNKIFETIISNQMKSFLNKHNIFYKYQYGFREKHSTDHALIEIVDGIKLAIDSSKLAGGIFVDLSKAFDTVNHRILLEKLHHLGIRGIPNKLLESYLTNRHQYVQINDSKSSLRPITCGVPQGSVLGPLLFILYINDLVNACSTGRIRIFADDTAVYFVCSNIHELIQLVTEIMEHLDIWFSANLLTLNTDKSYFCIFRTTQNHINNLPDEIIFNDKSIKRASSIKYLGITLDEFLNWNEHVTNIIKSLNSLFSVFYNIRRYLTIEHIKMIYYTMIYSRIKYGICAYGFAKKENMDKVQILQNKLLKVLLEKKWRTPTNELHNKLDILLVNDLFTQEVSTFVHNYLHGNLPDVFGDYYQTMNHQHDTRGNQNSLVPPLCRTELGKKTVKVLGCKVWNDLSQDKKNIKNPKAFRKAYKNDKLKYPE